MNKTAIRNFAVWARNKLINDVTYRAGLMGVTVNGVAEPLPQSTDNVHFFDIGMAAPYQVTGEEIRQRKSLVDIIRRKETESDYRTAFKSVIEEVAYTWFNRLIAIRFMEVNDYLPSHIRILSSESGKNEPDIVTNPFDADFVIDNDIRNRIVTLKNDNKLDEVFSILFILQCRELSEILPYLFEKTNDYSELLFNISFIDKESVVYHLINDIDESDFNVELGGQVEIIGWLYQYYNAEIKEEVINLKNSAVSKENIPAATQLFTTDWVVKYIVDNSLGKYWIERNPDSKLAEKLRFFAWNSKDIEFVSEKINPEDIRVLDPCMGSGHFLVYAFDVLMNIYEERGYSQRDAAKSIIENNIFGLDIDNRAAQLSYFAVMMKGRQYNRRILSLETKSNIWAINESNGVELSAISLLKQNDNIAKRLVDVFLNLKEIGSIQSVNISVDEITALEMEIDEVVNDSEDADLFTLMYKKELEEVIKPLIRVAKILINKYQIVVTNPPYLNKYSAKLKKFVVDNYKDYSGDLFSVFMYRNFEFCTAGGYAGFMTPYVWMFIGTYEKLRTYIIRNKAISSLVQMEYSAFEEATVPICAFVFCNKKSELCGRYFKLTDFRGGMKVQEAKMLEALEGKNTSYVYDQSQECFEKIPGMPIAYWAAENTFNAYEKKKINDYYVVRNGISTGDNERYLRLWAEVDNSANIWKPCNKGGSYRKWYGNNEYFVFWKDDGKSIRTTLDDKGRIKARLGGIEYSFKVGIEMTRITSGALGFRISEGGFVYESSTNDIYTDSNPEELLFALGYFNSCVGGYFLGLMNPTINVMPEDIRKMPYIESASDEQKVEKIVSENIELSRSDWDSFETSWDFKKHPLI